MLFHFLYWTKRRISIHIAAVINSDLGEPMDIYIEDSAYDRLVDALTKLEPCPFSGQVEPWSVVEALGEIAGIWPKRIEAEARMREEREAA
jgi:hypothetical protein